MKCWVTIVLAEAVLSACAASAFQVRTSQRVTSPTSGLHGPHPIPRKYRDRDDETEDFMTAVAATTAAENVAPSKPASSGSGADRTAVGSVAMSQALVLVAVAVATASVLAVVGHPIDMSTLHWNGSNQFYSFWDFQVTPLRFVEGVIAAFPVICLCNQVEQSDDRDASHVNFSTMNTVMTLFGRREHSHKATPSTYHPPETPMIDAMNLSIALAIITAVSEEIVFRGILPSVMFHFAQSVPATVLGQSLFFGLAHSSPKSTLGENKVICGLQAFNGLWYGLVYLISGGDILPCIIAHILYDVHVFMGTWMTINTQIDYIESIVLQKLPDDQVVEIRRIKDETPNLTTETLAHARRFFYAFDYEHQDSLSKSDVKRAVSYAFLHDKSQPSNVRVGEVFDGILQRRAISDDRFIEKNLQDRLCLPEFLRLLFLLKAESSQTTY